MKLTGWTRLALVAFVISVASIGTTVYWGLKAAEDGDSYKRYSDSLAPGWQSDADTMMLTIHKNNLHTLEDQLIQSTSRYATIRNLTLWGHAIAAALAIVIWVGLGFRTAGRT